MGWRKKVATFGVSFAVLAGCETVRPDDSVTVDTLANGAVSVRNLGPGLWPPENGWALTPVGTLGAAPEDTLAQFAQIWDFTVDDYGRLYVLDRQAASILVFTLGGAFVRRMGRPGQGPGELRGPTGLAWDPEGRLWVANVGNGRFEVFDTAGTTITSYPRTAIGLAYPWGGAFLESGALSEPSSVRDPATGVSRSVALVQRNPALVDGLIDTVGLPGFERWLWRVEHDRGRLVAGVPFAPDLRWQMDRKGELWFSVNDEYRIYRGDWSGDTTRVVSRVVERVPVSSNEIDSQVELFERTIPDFRSRVDLDLVPAFKPAYDVFFVDALGYLWVAQTRGDETYPGGFQNTFDIFDPDGLYLGSLTADISTVPPPKVFGDLLIGVSRDALEVQSLVVYRIEGRGEIGGAS